MTRYDIIDLIARNEYEWVCMEWDDILKSLQIFCRTKTNRVSEDIVAFHDVQREYVRYVVEYHDEAFIIRTNIEFRTKTGWLTDWKAVLLIKIAKYYYCRAIYDKRLNVAVIVGEERMIRFCTTMFNFITESIRDICNVEWRRQEAKGVIRKKEIKYRVGCYARNITLAIETLARQKVQIDKEISIPSMADYNKALDDEIEMVKA
jgi:hypothetical protein